MKWMKFWALVLGLLGVLVLGATVKLSFWAQAAPIQIVTPSQGAQKLTEDFMETLCKADFEKAGSMLLGQPKIDLGGGPQTQIGQLLWEAYADSLSYEFKGALSASDSGYHRPVTITALDISGVMRILKERTQTLLEERAGAVDSDVALDENDAYRENFVMEVLREEIARILGGLDITDAQRVAARELIAEKDRL